MTSIDPTDFGVDSTVVDEVRARIDELEGQRRYINNRHFPDVDARPQTIGRALRYLESEGELELYKDRRARRLYVRAEDDVGALEEAGGDGADD